jgi:Fe-S cluster assembly iron-binding protein IscA
MAVIEQDAIRVSSAPALMPIVGISESAATRLQSMMREKELQGYGLRVFVSGGG